MTTRLVTWGGGPDATHMLKCLLEETDDRIIAVTNAEYYWFCGERYAVAAKRAIEWLTPHLTAIRPFEHIVVDISVSGDRYGDRGLSENQILLFTPLALATLYPDPVIHIGVCADDLRPGAWYEQQMKDTFPPYVEACKGIAELDIFRPERTKVQIRKELDDLWELTWSCYHPTEELEHCGACPKCKARAAAERPTPAANLKKISTGWLGCEGCENRRRMFRDWFRYR